MPFILDPAKEIPKKIEKKFKKFKNHILTLFLAETGWDRPRKRKKNVTSELRSNSTRARNSEKNCKKSDKIKKPLPDIISSQNEMR